MAVIKIVPMPGAEGQQGDQGAVGPQGPQGETGAQGPAGADALWSYNGGWQSNATYAEGDLVTYDGQLYYATGITTLGVTPDLDSNFDLITEKGTDGTPLNFWNFVGDPGIPTVDGALVVDGISGRTGGNATIHATTGGKVVLAGSNGEFLFDSNIASNQIATIGDIENAISQSGSLTYKSGAVPATHHGVAGDTKNDIRYDDTHMYVCVQDYTDGVAIIWKRINWASGNW